MVVSELNGEYATFLEQFHPVIQENIVSVSKLTFLFFKRSIKIYKLGNILT